jgi:conjugative relaxase-like TrwC/TraI family protein
VAVVVTVAKGYDLGYVWKNQGQRESQAQSSSGEKTVGGYYINAAQHGEPPGRWWGPGAGALGFTDGQVVERGSYEAVYQQRDPQTGERLGRARGNYLTFADHLARLQAGEPHATAERLIELEREAAQATRQPAAYTDVTVSFSKSISVLHASIRENERRARLAGDERTEAYWAGREARFQEILHSANRAALEYLQTWAGVTRTGYHGVRVEGQEPGRFESAGLIVSSWLQGTSRDGDPQDHIHNQIARITQTFSDGRWRALDTASVRAVMPALQAVAATAVECGLTREFGVAWVPRPDGRGNEIDGVTQAQMDAYSTRTVAVREKERELAQSWERRNGRAPNSRQLLFISDKATLQSRKGKEEGEIDWDALAERWDATIGGELAGIAPAVSEACGPGGGGFANDADPGPEGAQPGGPPAREAQQRALEKALVLVSGKHPTWTRHELLKQLALVMPPEAGRMDAKSAQELLHGLADEVISGRAGDVVCVEAPQWPPLPASLRRELDGRSVYTRPGVARYATAAQLSMEDKLVAQAQTQAAPRLTRELAAQRLGADAGLLEAQLRERAHDARAHATQAGLRLDQAAAVWHALTSPRVVEVVTGPAGTGKTRVLAAAASAWDGPVTGTATSQNATNELRAAGVDVAANTTKLLAGLGRIRPGSLIVVDEGSMVSVGHLAVLVDHAVRHGCKLILAGDQQQLAAVEGGGAMALLASRLGYVQLAEPVRFEAAWERDASLRLRDRDPTALDDYDQHGRIHGAPPDQAMDQAANAYVANYLAGRDVVLTAVDWNRCRELSLRIRDDLIHLGHVGGTRTVPIAEGAEASVGDLVICRTNDHRLEAGEPGRTLANGDVLRIEAITPTSIQVRRQLDPDRATGERRFTERAFHYQGYASCDLAYAVTGHSAQGGTVHTGITLVTGNEDRQWLYSAMTRGTHTNLVYVSTTPAKVADPASGTRPAPELDRYDRRQQERAGYLPAHGAAGRATGGPDPREPIAVLADILDRDGTQHSATQTRQRNLASADHLAVLNSIWTAETRDAHHSRYHDLMMAALPPEYRQKLSHQATWLYRTLRSAELAGLDPAEVARSAIESRDLAGARDVAAVIDARTRQRIYPLLPQPQGRWADRVPSLPDPERRAYLAEIATMMDDRKQRLGEHAAQTAPAWAVNALGPVPEDPADRQDWEHKASAIGAYREMHGHQHPTDPIGPEPTHDNPDQRAAWHEAFQALGPADGPDVRGMPDGRLWLIRDTYAAETCWAPRHVGKELRLVRMGAHNADLGAIREDAEAQAACKEGEAERAARHDGWAASYRAMRDRYQAQEEIFAKTMTDRTEWEQATGQTRHLAVAADAELRRRHPDQRIEPVRSAEPEPASDTDRQELQLAPDKQIGEMAAWVSDLAAQRQAFDEKLAERQALPVPSEDPEEHDLGPAFPAWNPPERDAILQPPKPEIPPAAKVMELAREQEAGREATD